MSRGTGRIYAYTTPAYRKTRWTGPRRGRGLIKVGYTTREPHVRIKEQIGASSPEKEPYKLLLTAKARTRRGKEFTDKDVHRELRKAGVRNVHNEWFEARPEDVRKALAKVGARRVQKGKPRRQKRRERRGRWLTVILLALILAGMLYPDHAVLVLNITIAKLLEL